MSILSRLLGKPGPATGEPSAPEPASPAASTQPDPAARAREEEQSLVAAIEAGDAPAIGRWVLEGSSTRIRQQAAQAVHDPALLLELIRATRGGRDKNVYRILTATRDAQLAQERRLATEHAEIEATAAAIARHADRPVDTLYAATLAQLESRWRELSSRADAAVQIATAGRLLRAHDALDEHRRVTEAEAERQRAAAVAAEEARQQQAREAAAASAAAAATAAAAAADEAQRRESARQLAEAQREAAEAEVRHLLGLLRQAQAALDHGGSARAARLRADIETALPNAPPLPPWFAGRLQQFDARIEELKDWKTFTVAPKRGELLARMQGLVGAEMSPEELARHIRRLRDEWRSLHRGPGEATSPEWQEFDRQFNEIAERAYEPCRGHFAEQAAQRHENQRRREALIERLTAFAGSQSDESTDWRAIQHALFESRREWREYAPVDQGVVQELQARFHAVLDPLQARLDAEHARNVAAKRDLIARAAALQELPDGRAAIEQSKELQRAWKSVGPVPRHLDNTLWREFRRHCDAVFERGAQESAARGAALAAGEARATALCEDVEGIAGLAGEALAEGLARLGGLRAEFEALSFSQPVARGLQRRFERAIERCRATQHAEHAAAARRGWSEVLAAAGTVRGYALARALGRPTEEIEEQRAVAAAAIAGLAHAGKAAKAALESRLAGLAGGDAETDLAAHEAALRLLCVRAELATGRTTPPEDQERRREYQMQRLVAAMGQGERSRPGDLEDLALEWIAVGPVAAGVEPALRERFEACWGVASRD